MTKKKTNPKYDVSKLPRDASGRFCGSGTGSKSKRKAKKSPSQPTPTSTVTPAPSAAVDPNDSLNAQLAASIALIKQLQDAFFSGGKPRPSDPSTITTQPPSAPTPAPTKVQTTHYAFVLDKSGSMERIKHEAVNAFNDNVATLQKLAVAPNTRVTITPVLFNHTVDVLNKGAPIGALHPMDILAYNRQLGGNTALLDAVGVAVNQLLMLPVDKDKEDVAYMVIVITDGDENHSRIYVGSKFQQLLSDVANRDDFTLSFLLPRGYKTPFLRNFPAVPEGNVAEWETTSAGTQRMSQQLGASVQSYMQQRSTGVRSSKSFFTTNAADLTETAVRAKLQQVPGAKIWQVPSEIGIQEFCNAQGVPYVIGKCFYQLTKREDVQFHKSLLIVKRGARTVFGGDVRSLLGLPSSGDARVVPGNHGDWEIYVQSTSTNRKLVRGTRLVYIP